MENSGNFQYVILGKHHNFMAKSYIIFWLKLSDIFLHCTHTEIYVL